MVFEELSLKEAIRWLRISYWTGAVTATLAALQMFVPWIFAAIYRQPGPQPLLQLRYEMGMRIPVMLGWTVLLLWANRDPFERRGVLLITIVPVIAGLVINESWPVLSGLVALEATLPVWGLQVILILLFGFGLLKAERATLKTP